MPQSSEPKAVRSVEINGIVVGEVVPTDTGKFVVRGLRETWDTPDQATAALMARRAQAAQLAEEMRKKQAGVRITVGRTLYDAVVENGLWIGRPVTENKTQITVEVEQTDHAKAALEALIERLEENARQATRLDSNSMRSRALIGAARQQISKL
jgi:hypothetical protein